jgi:hypothetical protein
MFRYSNNEEALKADYDRSGKRYTLDQREKGKPKSIRKRGVGNTANYSQSEIEFEVDIEQGSIQQSSVKSGYESLGDASENAAYIKMQTGINNKPLQK